MNESHKNFYERIRGISRRYDAMGEGYTSHVRADGLILLTPKSRPILRRSFLVKPLVLFALGFFVFKAFVFFSLGANAYQDRLADLSTGTKVEQVGAYLMYVDPATDFLAGVFERFLG